MTVTLSQDEVALVLAIGRLVEAGRPAGTSFTSRALGQWLPGHLPRHMRSERVIGPLLDLMEVEPNPRTSRRLTQDLKEVLPEWTALAQAQQNYAAPKLIGF